MIFKKYIHFFLLFFWGTIIVLYLVKPIFNKYDSKDTKPKLIKKNKEKPKEKEDDNKNNIKKNKKKEDNKDDIKKKKKDDDKDKKNKNKKDDSKEEKKKKKEKEEKKKKKEEEEKKKKKKEEDEKKKKKKKKEEERKKKKEEEEKKKKALTEDDIVEYDDVGQLSYEVITDDEDDDISVKVRGTTVFKGMLMEHPSDNLKIKNPYNKAAIDIALGIINDNKRMNENILKKSGYDEEEWYANTFKLNQSDDDKDIITINNYDNYKK